MASRTALPQPSAHAWPFAPALRPAWLQIELAIYHALIRLGLGSAPHHRHTTSLGFSGVLFGWHAILWLDASCELPARKPAPPWAPCSLPRQPCRWKLTELPSTAGAVWHAGAGQKAAACVLHPRCLPSAVHGLPTPFCCCCYLHPACCAAVRTSSPWSALVIAAILFCNTRWVGYVQKGSSAGNRSVCVCGQDYLYRGTDHWQPANMVLHTAQQRQGAPSMRHGSTSPSSPPAQADPAVSPRLLLPACPLCSFTGHLAGILAGYILVFLRLTKPQVAAAVGPLSLLLLATALWLTACACPHTNFQPLACLWPRRALRPTIVGGYLYRGRRAANTLCQRLAASAPWQRRMPASDATAAGGRSKAAAVAARAALVRAAAEAQRLWQPSGTYHSTDPWAGSKLGAATPGSSPGHAVAAAAGGSSPRTPPNSGAYRILRFSIEAPPSA